MNPLLVFLILLNAYFLLIFVLLKTGLMRRWNMALFGPALMIKTERGRGLLDWFARARGFFDRTTTFGLYFTAVIMALMSLLMIAQLAAIFSIPAEAVPSPRLILGIPGINPIIPIGFGIVALIFAVVVHEFSHGILARVQDLRVKTMGLLLFIIPIGAFVEPDEEQMKAAPRRQRLKVFAAGPMSNLFFAILFGLLFSSALMGNVEPSVDGVLIGGIEQGGPADQAGLRPGDIVTMVDQFPVSDARAFADVMRSVPPGTQVLLSVHPSLATHALVTQSCTDLYQSDADPSPEARNESRTFCRERLGIANPDNRSFVGVRLVADPDPRTALGAMQNPFGGLREFFYYIGMPFFALNGEFPLAGVMTTAYDTPFDAELFWMLANAAFWLMWINLMLGLTNALPILPLDGGHMFRDFLGAAVDRLGWPRDKERFVKRVSLWVTFIILAAVLLPFIVPRLIVALR